MKKLSCLLILVFCVTFALPQVTFGFSRPTSTGEPVVNPAPRANLAMLLAELETNMSWGSVYGTWKKRRDSWLADCQRASSPQQTAALLAEFESNVTWEMVEGGWRKRRDGWVAECKRATTAAQIASLLVEFESNVKWSAVGSRWKARRDGWIREVSSAR
ncbi:MAG: hypothetical protein K1Y36_00165 [Blastocatellia bacterium]|nr:hypothetical protein [Blastocatellia bacterium]